MITETLRPTVTGEIVGHGDIARVLTPRDGFTYFASGVSNSQETDESAYQREYRLLLCQDREKHLVYFSSLSVLYSDSRYAKHKRLMERTVRDTFRGHTIVRLGNITWGDNPHTLINFLRGQQERGEPMDIQDTYRYVVDKE